MSKPFSNLFNKDKAKKSTLPNKKTQKKVTEKSKPLIIIGFIISLSSIFLLLLTINNKFGNLSN